MSDVWEAHDPIPCALHGSETCEHPACLAPAATNGHDPAATLPIPALDPAHLADAAVVAAEGRAIAEAGIPYVVDGIIPAYGMLGMSVAAAKVGKTTFGVALAAAVATESHFLGRQTQRARVLAIAAEDPPTYTAYLARHLHVPEGAMTYYRAPIQLDAAGLLAIQNTIATGQYGLVLIASWQAVISGLVRDENDNAGAVAVVERAKLATRATGIPWLIDAHAGKTEDQRDDADPTKALRGASAAAGSADFLLSLRYAEGPFSTRRRLSGKGRFVRLEPLLIDYDDATGTYTAIGDTKSAAAETTWRLIVETGALSREWQSAPAIAVAAGLAASTEDATRTVRRQIAAALKGRPGVDRQTIQWRKRDVTQYRRSEEA